MNAFNNFIKVLTEDNVDVDQSYDVSNSASFSSIIDRSNTEENINLAMQQSQSNFFILIYLDLFCFDRHYLSQLFWSQMFDTIILITIEGPQYRFDIYLQLI